LVALFQEDVRTINEHLVDIYDEGELARGATVRKLRIVRSDGCMSCGKARRPKRLPERSVESA
jgi:hypothetical protein